MTSLPETDPLRKDIEQYAYFLYEQRGGEPGHELEDWLEAEKQLTSAVSNAARGTNPSREEQSSNSREAKRPGRKAQ